MPVATSFKVGNLTIHRIVEQEGPFFDALTFFPKMSKEILAENRAWLQPRHLDAQDKIMLCIQSYIVQTPTQNIMIDTCVGNHKERPTRPFWHHMKSEQYERNLASARAEAQKMLDDAKLQQQAITAELKQKSEIDLAQMRDKAKRDIEAAKGAAIAEIHAHATSLATAMASKILKREINAGDQQRLIQESLQEMGAGRA